MHFGEKLRKLRTDAGMTQGELAEKLNISKRTVINYEQCKYYPNETGLYTQIAKIFSVDAGSLLSDEDIYISAAADKGGSKAARDVKQLLSDVGGLFAGGELSEEDKDKVMRTINELYWTAKENNRKYAPRAKSRRGGENS